MKIRLPEYLWYDPREVEYGLPDDWDVTVHNIAGYNKPAVTSAAIKAALASPIGMPSLREIARGKKEAVILFDDLTRATRTYEIVPHILEELHAAGFTPDRIRFIAAVANHQALDRISMAKKLGDDVVARYTVYNHCPFMNCTDLGTSSYGTPVKINSEVMSCDLKIGISQTVPHPLYSFSGGAKIIVPGVAAYETVAAHHGTTHEGWKQERIRQGLRPMSAVDDSPINLDAREMAKMAGLDMTINCIANMWGETVEIYAGALEPAYEAAVKAARKQYITPIRGYDIVIATPSSKPPNRQWPGENALQPSSARAAISHHRQLPPDRTFTTYDNFERPSPHHPPRKGLPRTSTDDPYSEFRMRVSWTGSRQGRVFLMSGLAAFIDRLALSGKKAKVAVYPSADVQYFRTKTDKNTGRIVVSSSETEDYFSSLCFIALTLYSTTL
jgi:nickel-dependent lactate racemase